VLFFDNPHEITMSIFNFLSLPYKNIYQKFAGLSNLGEIWFMTPETVGRDEQKLSKNEAMPKNRL